MTESLSAIERLGDRNFPGWGLQIEQYLSLKGKEEWLLPFVVIEGEDPTRAAAAAAMPSTKRTIPKAEL